MNDTALCQDIIYNIIQSLPIIYTLKGMKRTPQKKNLCAISSTWIDKNYYTYG